MRRLVLLVLTTAMLVAGCGSEVEFTPAVRAAPQRFEPDWVERYPATGDAIFFRVSELVVTESGWTIAAEIENRTGVNLEIPSGGLAFRRQFGLMVFTNGDLEELERLNRAGNLPTLRRARTFEPAPPDLLGAGETWRGRIAGVGPLPSGTWLRVAFGPLVVVGDPPEGMRSPVNWITDHAVLLT